MDELKNQTIETPLFSFDGRVFKAKCVKCYDADSIHIVFKYKGEYIRFKCRLWGIDTPELRSKNMMEKQIAKQARDKMKEWVLDTLLIVKCGEFDKYGRLLVYIYPYDNTTKQNDIIQLGGDSLGYMGSINERLVEKGLAYHYDGGKKKKFNDWFK
jgi:endonuclease YncB( thermonuclease family)